MTSPETPNVPVVANNAQTGKKAWFWLRRNRTQLPSREELEFMTDAEAIEFQPHPVVTQITFYLLLSVVVIMVSWASLCEIDRIVVSRGKLVTTQPTIIVQPLETAIIRSIDVQVGQVVHVGESLVTLDSTFSAADVAHMLSRRKSLLSQRRRAEAELNGDSTFSVPDPGDEEAVQIVVFRERQDSLRAKVKYYEEVLNRLTTQRTSNRKDIELFSRRLKGFEEIASMRADLFRNMTGSRLNFLEVEDQRLEMALEVSKSQNRDMELRQEMAVQEAERDTFLRERRQKVAEELIDVMREVANVEEQLAKAQRRRELVLLTSPAEAVVLEVAPRSIGSVAREAEPLVTLVPLNAPLQVEAQIAASDIGFIRVGDHANIKVDAFPFQRHGILKGVVSTISEDAFTSDSQPGQITSISQRGHSVESFYRTRVDVGPANFRSVPSGTRLLPGMTVGVEIIVGRRLIISYFLYPILKAFDEAIREQ
ncbi:Membrane fusion protein (MFP) family protein [Azospirillaceae bacterium]